MLRKDKITNIITIAVGVEDIEIKLHLSGSANYKNKDRCLPRFHTVSNFDDDVCV